MALLAEASCSPTAAAECVDNRFSYYMSLGMVTAVNLSQLLSATGCTPTSTATHHELALLI